MKMFCTRITEDNHRFIQKFVSILKEKKGGYSVSRFINEAIEDKVRKEKRVISDEEFNQIAEEVFNERVSNDTKWVESPKGSNK